MGPRAASHDWGLQTTSTSSTAPTTASNLDNILEDATGHVNRDLAERIWNWEQQSRKENALPKVEYSVRAGLRLVDTLVQEQLTQASQPQDMYYGDLIQEGLSALLTSMRQYQSQNQQQQSSYSGHVVIDRHQDEYDDFERYASDKIRQQLVACLDRSRRPMRVPRSVQSVVRQARSMLQKNEQTIPQVAAQLDLPVARLQEYLRLTRDILDPLSMESTVEIVNPVSDASEFRDQEEWELRQGLLLDNGRQVHREELVDEYLDESLQREGDDEAWMQLEQIAGPLQDLIPDKEAVCSGDEQQQDQKEQYARLSDFVAGTLSDDKMRAVRLYFGLDSRKPLSILRTAQELGRPVQEVAALLKESVEELRHSYTAKYLDDDLFAENSV